VKIYIVTRKENPNGASTQSYSKIFPALLVAGLLTFLIGIALLTVAASLLVHGNSTNFGVIIFLSPIPIVIGAGPEPSWILLAATAFGVLALIALLLKRKR
jgi:uncharacterized membrane protein